MTHPQTPIESNHLERVTVDFNNLIDDDIVIASTRRSADLHAGQQVTLTDPGEPQEYLATVDAIVGRTIRFKVEWKNH